MQSSRSTGKDDEFESDVELCPPSSGSSMNTSTNTTVASANTTLHTDDDNLRPTKELRVEFRSRCKIDDIPDVARGLTWTDPFYDTNDDPYGQHADIIAAFDIDRTCFDRWTIDLCKWFFLIPLMCVPLVLFDRVFGISFDVAVMLCSIYGPLLLMTYVVVACCRWEEKLRIKRTHIAVGTRGIYLDEVERTCPLVLVAHLNRSNAMRRTFIAYDEIKKCQVQSWHGCLVGSLYYNVYLNTKDDYPIYDDDNPESIIGYEPRHIFRGIKNPQVFVDIVNAMIMMKRTAHLATAGDIDLFPPRSAGTTGSIDLAVASERITARTDTKNDDSGSTGSLSMVDAEELISYRSKCHIDDIPEPARGLTWTDPFYATNDCRTNQDIIAAFDMDRPLEDRTAWELYSWHILTPTIFVGLMAILRTPTIGIEFFVDWSWLFYLVYGFCAPGYYFFYLMFQMQIAEKKLRLRCAHTAISTHGIYIDEVDYANSNKLMRRTKIAFNEINTCQLKYMRDIDDRDIVVVRMKDECRLTNEKGEYYGTAPGRIIIGIKNPQAFVDIVNAMMERQDHVATSPVSPTVCRQ